MEVIISHFPIMLNIRFWCHQVVLQCSVLHKVKPGPGLFSMDDMPYMCLCWIALEEIPSSLCHQLPQVNAAPADSPLSWMVYFRVSSPHQCLRGTSLHSYCTDQCILNRTTTDQQMGAKTKLCPLHFALLSCIVWRGQSHHAVMWGDNDGST